MIRHAILALLLLALTPACGLVDDGLEWVDEAEEELGGEVDLEEVSWDVGAPEVEEGTLMKARFICGLMDGAFDAWFRMSGDTWKIMSDNGRPIPELEPCGEGPDLDEAFDWEDDGAIYFTVGATAHWLNPSTQENRWVGKAGPLEPTQGCLDAAADYGVDLPVTLTMEITEYVNP